MPRVILRNGTVAVLRRAGTDASDEQLIRDLFRSVSAESLYFRFFHMVREVSQDVIDSMLLNDGGQSLSLICVSSGKALGVGTYVRQDETTAEVALLVADELHGHGIGTLLLEELASLAWQYGFRRFEANVLVENQKMLKVFQASGFERGRKWISDAYQLTLELTQTEATRALQETREKFAVAASLMPFFQPKHIAIVGASRDVERLGHLMLRHIFSGQFQGTVYPVNPMAESISGILAYPDIESIPASIDLAIIVVPAWQILSVVDDCIRAGVKSVLITSSLLGQLAEGGEALEKIAQERLRSAGVRLIGPSSLGIVNTHPAVQLNASFAPSMPRRGHLSIASQSGALGIAILDTVSRMGVGVSSFCATGTKIDVSSNDLLLYWEDDASTEMIALYLESFGNPRKFSRIARRITKRKPILAVKSARTQKGASASKFSVQAASQPDSTIEALFVQAGIIRLDTLPELFDTAALLTHAPLPNGKRVAIVTNTAGGAVMVVDAIERSGLVFVGPPIDLGWEALPQGYREVLPQVLRDDSVDAVIVLFSPVGVPEEDAVAWAILDAMDEVFRDGTRESNPHIKPVIANFLPRGEAVIRTIGNETRQIPVYPYPEQAVHALARVAEYAAYLERPAGRVPDLQSLDTETARERIRQWLYTLEHENASDVLQLSPVQTFQILQDVGICEGEPCEAGGKETDAEAFATVKIVAEFDRLFGPVIHVDLHTRVEEESLDSLRNDEHPVAHPGYSTVPNQRVTRLVPLTDIDARDIAAALLPAREVDASLESLLLRVSRLMDEVPEVRVLKMVASKSSHANHFRVHSAELTGGFPI